MYSNILLYIKKYQINCVQNSKTNNIKINIIDLRPDPNYEIDSTYYSMSDREAKNTGLSIGLGGFLGFMAFNGIKGSVSHTIYWLSGGYSNFEFDNADDEDASLEFFTLVHVMQFNETYWKKSVERVENEQQQLTLF